MKTTDEQLNALGDEFSLTREERQRMRRTLVSYIEMKPVRPPLRREARESAWSWRMLYSPRLAALLLILALFSSSAGISYAAESALPGDALYAVKTNINERVAGALAVSASEKSAWAADVAGERIKEAATLAAEGRLSPSTQQNLQQNFNTHADIAIAAIDSEASSSPEASVQSAVSFGAQLEAYRQVLDALAPKENGSDALAVSIAAKQDELANVQAHLPSRGGSQASSTDALAAGIRKAARAQLEATLALSEHSHGALDASSSAAVALQLNDASSAISGGDDQLASNAGAKALSSFQKALSAAEKLGVFLETSASIHQRTGLVIGQPAASPSRAAEASGHSQKNGKRGEGAAGAATSASVVAATSSATSSAAAGVSGSGDGAEDSSNDSGEYRNIKRVIPLAVPLP